MFITHSCSHHQVAMSHCFTVLVPVTARLAATVATTASFVIFANRGRRSAGRRSQNLSIYQKLEVGRVFFKRKDEKSTIRKSNLARGNPEIPCVHWSLPGAQAADAPSPLRWGLAAPGEFLLGLTCCLMPLWMGKHEASVSLSLYIYIKYVIYICICIYICYICVYIYIYMSTYQSHLPKVGSFMQVLWHRRPKQCVSISLAPHEMMPHAVSSAPVHRT